MAAPAGAHPVLSNGRWGALSGEKPRYAAEAEPTHQNLVFHLKSAGISHEETQGSYEGPERSVIVHGPTREQMHRLGKMFGQESVVFSEGGRHELLYTNGPHEGKSLQSQQLEFFPHPPADYYTTLPGHGHFRINFDWNQTPQSPAQPEQRLARSEVPAAPARVPGHPHSYPWHEGHTDHHRVARNLATIRQTFGLAKADTPHVPGTGNEQAAGVGVSSYHRFAGPYGQVLGQGSPTSLKHYRYEGKAAAADALLKKYGFQHYYAGGKYGKPDLVNKNYNTGHLMVYDPEAGSGGDFGERAYTDTWRKVHELAHALTYPELNKIYGEGRRMGKLGTHRTPHEAQRAVHWEHLAAHKQRELSAEMGVHVTDDDFHRERNTIMHDAIHRAVTGQFTEPSAEGFQPHPVEIPLSHALDTVRNEAQQMGLQHPHAKLVRKGWPRNEEENVDPRATANVAFDRMLEQGDVPGQPKRFEAGVHQHAETTGLLDYDPASDNYVRSTGPGKPAAHVAGGPYVTEGDSVRAVLDPNDYPASSNGRRTVAAMREAATANATKLRPPQMNPLSFRPTTPGELHGKPPVTAEDRSGLNAVEGQTHTQLENAFWGDIDKAAARSPVMKWKQYGGKHPIDAIREQKDAREQKFAEAGRASDARLAQQRAETDRVADLHQKTELEKGVISSLFSKKPAAPTAAPAVRPYEPPSQGYSEGMKKIFASIPPKGAAPQPTGNPTVASGPKAMAAAKPGAGAPTVASGPKALGGGKTIPSAPFKPSLPSTIPGYDTAETKGLQNVIAAAPRIPGRMGKAETPVILAEQGSAMADEKTYTPAEAVAILKKAALDKISSLEADLKDLRKRETVKAMIPPHKHNTGSTVSVGVEDVPPGKLNPPGKDDPMGKGEPMEDTPGEETSGERSPADVIGEALCKECGLDKCMHKNAVMGYGNNPAAAVPGAMKAELADSKGNHKSNSEIPAASLPSDGTKHVNRPSKSDEKRGSGGTISRGVSSIKKSALEKYVSPYYTTGPRKPAPKPEPKPEVKKATPPMAKPPSGANMATKVPTSKPMGKDDSGAMGTPAASSGPGGLDKAGLPMQAKQHMNIAGSKAAAGGAPAAPAAKMPSPGDNAARASAHQSALAGDFQPKGPISSGLELARPVKPAAPKLASPKAAGIAPPGKPGIFGRIGK